MSTVKISARTNESNAQSDPRFASFSTWLRLKYEQARKRNSTLTLRAYSSHLNISHSTLSRIFAQKQIPLRKTIQQIGRQLGLTDEEIETRFLLQPRKRSRHGKPYRTIPLNQYQGIWRWYHYALLELVSSKGFQGNVAWISKVLGISEEAVESARAELIRSELLKISRSGKWKICYKNTTVGGAGDLSHAAIRLGQKESLSLATLALDRDPEFGKRFSGATTLSISPQLLPEAFERIKQFRRELAGFLESGNERNQVYHLVISLFPLSGRTDQIDE